ncbi:histidine phosphatase family protein [Archangium sp. Cb G35]|uniref:histidine phosphatase family protein n=1 Tax=Archangium sp. Cb G35 TaxID=1920190 RepID=UPI0013015A0C|nr:phosphoglycerate mutase family protein [Archangium sp. Cb G35]
MGVLTLVRHGQTSGEWYDRDRLSELGMRQAERLGEVWAAAEHALEAVYVGPAWRHQQTCEAVRAAYLARGLRFPEPVVLPELDEYSAEPLFRVLLPKLAERNDQVRELMESGALEGPDGARRLFRLLDPLGRAWARGELEDPAVERWNSFVSRVEAGLRKMMQQPGRKAEVVAFTSAGTMAVATGLTLEASAEKVFALSLMVWNTACTDFLFSGDRISLRSFDATPHLLEPGLQTLR